MIEDMQIRNLTPLTQRAYVEHVVRFARHFRKSPEHPGPAEIRTYQWDSLTAPISSSGAYERAGTKSH
jgi:hypothetical protein